MMGTVHHMDPAMLSLAPMLAAIPSLPRPILDRLVARMIDRLDEIDGEDDLEDGCDQEDIDEGEPEAFRAERPRYAIDQRLLLGEYSHRSGIALNVDTEANQRV